VILCLRVKQVSKMKKEDSVERTVRLSKTIRKTWGFNPRTRVKPAKKKYNRGKEKLQIQKELENDK